jgi:beta-RFAP synthase
MKDEQSWPAEGGWVRVRAPSRLHFGLLALPSVADVGAWPDVDGQPTIPRRHFGGGGLMIEQPALELAIRCAPAWSVQGPQGDRALEIALALDKQVGVGPCEIVVKAAPPAHAGLGSGTQLALSVAQTLRCLAHVPQGEPLELASLTQRGQRSAIGVHGFFYGGFLVEAGQGGAPHLGRLIVRERFPEAWKVIVVLPRGVEGLHGLGEAHAFEAMESADLAQTDAMCRLLLLGMLPAIGEKDLPAFGEALHDYNRRAGEMYRTIQGGPYAHRLTADIVQFLRQQGIAAAGQSSWGPATFAIVEEDCAEWVAQTLCKRFELAAEEVVCTQAENHSSRGGGY